MLGLCALLTFLGAALLAIGWYQVSGEFRYDDQVAGMNVAIAGLMVAGAATVLLLVAGWRAVLVRRMAVLGRVRPDQAGKHVLPDQSRPGADPRALVGGEGLRHFHRPDCALARDRDWAAASRVQHEQRGRTACGVCRP